MFEEFQLPFYEFPCWVYRGFVVSITSVQIFNELPQMSSERKIALHVRLNKLTIGLRMSETFIAIAVLFIF